MTLTLRQLAAWLEFMDRTARIERSHQLVTTMVGAQGDQKAIDKMLKDLES